MHARARARAGGQGEDASQHFDKFIMVASDVRVNAPTIGSGYRPSDVNHRGRRRHHQSVISCMHSFGSPIRVANIGAIIHKDCIELCHMQTLSHAKQREQITRSQCAGLAKNRAKIEYVGFIPSLTH